MAPPSGVDWHPVETAQQMFDVVKAACESDKAPDISIHAAAVADYRPKQVAPRKIKKGGDSLVIELERTRDVLGSMRTEFGFRGVLVGFAAETENVVPNAQEKLRCKRCDLVIANDVSRSDCGFDSDENEVILCLPSGLTETLPKQSKRALGREIVRRVVALAETNLHK
jgi:phosphopantothenoylcysteine synthetase/decarboxylase